MDIKVVNVADKLDQVKDHWVPRVVAELNGQHVKIAKLKGDFVMHRHDDEDELFYVLEGRLHIELEKRTLILDPGEFVVIPRGVDHRPFAPEEVSLLLFEPATTLNTGNVENEFTIEKPDSLS